MGAQFWFETQCDVVLILDDAITELLFCWMCAWFFETQRKRSWTYKLLYFMFIQGAWKCRIFFITAFRVAMLWTSLLLDFSTCTYCPTMSLGEWWPKTRHSWPRNLMSLLWLSCKWQFSINFQSELCSITVCPVLEKPLLALGYGCLLNCPLNFFIRLVNKILDDRSKQSKVVINRYLLIGVKIYCLCCLEMWRFSTRTYRQL